MTAVTSALRRLPAGSALEIGCDGGRWSVLLAEAGWSVIATDVKPNAVSLCQQRVPEARCVLVDPKARSLPCPDQSVSLVLCIEVQPVVQAEWFPDEVVRVLRPGGEVVGVTLNRRSLRGLVADAHTRLTEKQPHTCYRESYSTWRRRVQAAGLDLIDECGLCWFPFSRSSNSSWIPVTAAFEQRFWLSSMPSLSPWVVFTARKNG